MGSKHSSSRQTYNRINHLWMDVILKEVDVGRVSQPKLFGTVKKKILNLTGKYRGGSENIKVEKQILKENKDENILYLLLTSH